MDFNTTIVLTSLGVLLVMQLITLLLVVNTRAMVKNSGKQNLRRPDDRKNDNIQRRDNRQRPSGRQDSRRPERSAGAPDQPQPGLDRSLRDINLRLKSAEKDQEKARKEMQGSENEGNRDDRSSHRRNDRGGRTRSPRGGRRNSRRDNRDNSPQNSENRRNGNSRQSRPEESPSPSTVTPEKASPSTPEATAEQTDQEHGRRVVVKRRNLSAQEQQMQDRGESNRPEKQRRGDSESSAPQSAENTRTSENTEATEPTFGRR